MRNSYNEPGAYHSTPYYTYEPRHPAPPPRVPPHSARYRNRWPPSPSVEDETAALTREVRSSVGSGSVVDDGEAKTRGTVDQYPIIQEMEQPANDERRFVLVSDPIPDGGTPGDRRRRSVADRGGMAHLKTDLDDAPLVAERTSTPYAYTKPQKESLALSPGEYYLSPETVAPSSSSIPRSLPARNRTDARDQNTKPAKQVPLPDWHATYPPATDRSRPTTRPERYETMPVPPMPQINVKSPSPARAARAENPLPYPVDDRPTEAFMPPEEQFQHDHAYASYTPITSSPRMDRLDSPIFSSPRERQSGFRPQPSSRKNTTDDVPRSPRVRSNSVRSQNDDDGARKERRTAVPLSLDRPLPSCPRSEPSSKYTDWYTLQNCPSFDICPSCYEGVFSDTPFSRYFTQGRRYERPVERFCDFSSPWMRLAWLLTIKQRRQSPDLLYTLATIADQERPCPGDRELGTDHAVWYGVSDPRDGIHVANFALCPCDLRMVEELFPSIKGYFTRIPASTSPYAIPPTYTCSLRVKSRRFPKYLDLLVELDAEAQAHNQHPHIARFVQLAREHAFKAECQRDKPLLRKAWHFMPVLPEFTVCQECFDELIWPHLAPPSSSSPSTPSTIPKLFTRTIQPVPGEDLELGSSCCLYSPRMRAIFETAVREENFGYLERKALERKRAEVRLGRERRDILGWMDGLERGTWEWEKAKVELRENEDEWRAWE
ncbi:uncharacterized protein CC84DRAFT_1147927 [Paraphaeosphaeria sporulosa]|uniref:Uncharacterized protein n=1 Tax=Paraphaeosphaeria sporulosa TaxID=1460663 RepID=A0A177CDF8_9PLEO|nr:uncharacterized protein CC84DRAFT_1147927 [Paraphaeosphaeria sporulosa]OAG04922.1 hypothetical protein CC84DRAFT_1147927 [Paraphaeosphaeria sporulosa]